MRTATIQRNRIEGRGNYPISTGIRFFDHMLELFTRHGGFDLTLVDDINYWNEVLAA